MSYPVIPAPYLTPLPDDKKSNTYTLVLDLDETLVHYKTNVIFFSTFLIIEIKKYFVV
jgi:hypothetical protein